MSRVLISLFLTLGLFTADVFADEIWWQTQRLPQRADETVPIENFHKVSEGIYRGARPGVVGVAALARMGIKTDINLDNNDDLVREEENAANTLGIRFVNLSLSKFWRPQERKVEVALAILRNPEYHPVFVHCKLGKDRTGVVVGLHRVLNEGWSKEDAYQEMLDIGFHPSLFLLKRYFEHRAEEAVAIF